MIANIRLENPFNFVKENGYRVALKVGAALIGLGLLIWFRQPVAELLVVVSDREAVAAYLAQFGILAPLLLSIILVLQVIVAAIPGHALMVGGGFVFGFGPAIAISLLATVLGSQIGFLLARWAGRPLIEKLAPVDVLDKWYDVSARKGLLFFMFAFMVPIFPADVLNYVAGLSSLSARRFFVANLVGRLPGVLLMTAIGAYGFQLSLNVWLVIAAAGLLLAGSWWLLFGRRR